MHFSSSLDARCQRGLHWRYRLDEAVAHLAGNPAAMASLHGVVTANPQVRFCEETWGPVSIQRYILPFRFELRLWVRPGELSFIHRASTPPPLRDRDRTLFEALLHRWIAQEARP